MPYQYFYDHVVNLPPSVGSRTNALIYPGAVCPQSARYGLVHGTAPAIGEIHFKGTVLVPIAQVMTIQIGQSTFYGFAVKGEIQNHISSGNNVKFTLVDMRDKLHDQNHAAQYNMVDTNGTWWHLLPDYWNLQIPSFIHDLEEVVDISTGQEVPNYDLNLLADCPPPFSLMTLMQAFALWYNFTFSWTASAGDKLETHYPENIDFNTPTKVIDCIDQMLSRSNLQFTCWGDLHLHITDKGVPDNQFEQDILAGTVDLCALTGRYVDASIGSELNTKGRRVIVTGGRSQYEYWYPCYPDWPECWTWHMVNPFSYDISALLMKYNLFDDVNLIEDLPQEFWDCRLYNGKSRMKMTIRDYINAIPFKAYRVDFSVPMRQFPTLEENEEGILEEVEPKIEDFQFLGPLGQPAGFLPYEWFDPRNTPPAIFDAGYYDIDNVLHIAQPAEWDIKDSLYPISQKLVSDTGRQFMCKGSVRFNYHKGEKDDKAFFFNGSFSYITDGVGLEVTEYIRPSPPDPSLQGQFNAARRNLLKKSKNKCEPPIPETGEACRKYYRAVLYFDQIRFKGHDNGEGDDGLAVLKQRDGVPANYTGSGASEKSPRGIYEVEPDHIYALISLDREVYAYSLGESGTLPRVRETVVNYGELKNFVKEFQPVPMLARNYIEYDYISIVFADELANEIAQRKLNHELITTSGHITFRTNSGFLPSGIIDNVDVSFSARSGTSETINFTNIRSDDRIPSFQPALSTRGIKNEETIRREYLAKRLEMLRQQANQELVNAHIKAHLSSFNLLKSATRFGIIDNAAAMKMDTADAPNEIEIGELMIVDQADNQD